MNAKNFILAVLFLGMMNTPASAQTSNQKAEVTSPKNFAEMMEQEVDREMKDVVAQNNKEKAGYFKKLNSTISKTEKESIISQLSVMALLEIEKRNAAYRKAYSKIRAKANQKIDALWSLQDKAGQKNSWLQELFHKCKVHKDFDAINAMDQGDQYIFARFDACKEDRPTFSVNGKTYDTYTGRQKK